MESLTIRDEWNLKTELEEVLTKLEKANYILSKWIEDYGFAERPDPRAALACSSEKDRSEKAVQAFQWYYDYENILTMIEIAFDYVYESKKALSQVIYGKSHRVKE